MSHPLIEASGVCAQIEAQVHAIMKANKEVKALLEMGAFGAVQDARDERDHRVRMITTLLSDLQQVHPNPESPEEIRTLQNHVLKAMVLTTSALVQGILETLASQS